MNKDTRKPLKAMNRAEELPNFCQVFPPEIIEQVFTQLTVEELKTFMEVCRRFESVIVNSPIIMKKFVVRWGTNKSENKDQMELMPASKRKYRKIHFWYDAVNQRGRPSSYSKASLEAIIQFVENQSKTLKSIVFLPRAVEMFKILPAVSDLESLEIGWYESYDEASSSEISLKQLKRLAVFSRGDEPILWLMKQPMKLEYFRFEERHRENGAKSLVPFLQSQDQLKEVVLAIENLSDLFSGREVATSMKFKAKVISLDQEYNDGRASKLPPGSVQLPHLSLFLDTQKESLQELALSNICLFENDLDAVLKLSLVKLKLYKCKFLAPEDSNFTNKSIQSLAITAYDAFGRFDRMGIDAAEKLQIANDTLRAVNKIIQSCQALNTLELSGKSLKMPETISSIATLRTLKIFKCTLSEALNLPSVKVLKVNGLAKSANSKLIDSNPQLESFESIKGGGESDDEEAWRYGKSFIRCGRAGRHSLY